MNIINMLLQVKKTFLIVFLSSFLLIGVSKLIVDYKPVPEPVISVQSDVVSNNQVKTSLSTVTDFISVWIINIISIFFIVVGFFAFFQTQKASTLLSSLMVAGLVQVIPKMSTLFTNTLSQ